MATQPTDKTAETSGIALIGVYKCELLYPPLILANMDLGLLNLQKTGAMQKG